MAGPRGRARRLRNPRHRLWRRGPDRHNRSWNDPCRVASPAPHEVSCKAWADVNRILTICLAPPVRNPRNHSKSDGPVCRRRTQTAEPVRGCSNHRRDVEAAEATASGCDETKERGIALERHPWKTPRRCRGATCAPAIPGEPASPPSASSTRRGRFLRRWRQGRWPAARPARCSTAGQGGRSRR